MSCRGQTNCKRAVKPHRPKVEPIRNPTLFEMERLEDTATLPNTVTPDRPYSLPGILLGTSSFTAAGWEGSFNPQGMRSTEYLAFYAERFQTVEIDSTFYGCPIPRTVSNWAARTQTINPKTILDAAYRRLRVCGFRVNFWGDSRRSALQNSKTILGALADKF